MALDRRVRWSNSQWTLGFILLLIYFGEILGFNLDTKAPIIKSGRPNSYFGYSVAHHLIRNRITDASESVFLVGAPRDNITDPSVSNKVRELIRPGAVYQCPYSSELDNCVSLKLDFTDPPLDEDKNDQWMGVSVSSEGKEDGSALACAHRFKKTGQSFRHGLGICAVLSNTLDTETFLEPCDGLKKEKGHEEYAFCQAGISSAITKGRDLLLGAPGPYNWRGALFRYKMQESLDDEVPVWHRSPVGDPADENPAPPATNLYSYLGMSVKIGEIINNNKTYIGGAPRANESGQVLMFLSERKALTIKPVHILPGEQFGSYFGYDFALGDFNSDRKQDIAVGAPFYRGEGIGGAIYIYMNGPEGITSATKPLKIVSRKMKDQECTELDCHNARFGFALANIGDLDRDGFDDLAVGAPYEGGGAVYIFRGSAFGIIKEYSQRIASSQFPTSPLAFGASLAGNFDLDQNGYTDVTIGAFSSDKIFVLRSRPVIKVESVLMSIPNVINPKQTQCSKDGLLNNCFEVKVCFQFTAEPVERFTGRIELNYTLEAEKFTGSVISRVFFKGSEDAINRTIHLNEQSKKEFRCHENLVYIMRNNKDFLNPIPFQLTYYLHNLQDPVMNPGGPLPDMNSFPVLNEALTKQLLLVPFMKNCGEDDLCQSNLTLNSSLNLQKHEGDYLLRVGLDETVLYIDIKNRGEDAHEATVTIILPTNLLTYRGTDDEGKKYSCNPFDAETIVCAIGNPLLPRQSVKFGIRLDAGNAVPSREKFKISVNVTTTSAEVKTDDDVAELRFRVVTETDLLVRGYSDPESVYFGGEVQGESAIKIEDQIGSEVKHSYEVKNVGRARVPKSTLFISWPYELQSEYPMGKHVLYILEKPLLEGKGECYFDSTKINPLKIRSRLPSTQSHGTNVSAGAAMKVKEDEKFNQRKRRNVDNYPKVEKSTDSSRNIKYATVDCEDNTAKCYRFNCTLDELLPGESAVLKIRSRLWNSTFLEDFSNLDEVRISSIASVEIDPAYNIQQTNQNNDRKKVTTTAKPEVQEQKGVPIWIIIVSVIAGVILLAVIILLLFACGFFRRQQRDQMIQHKAKMERKSYDEFHD